LEFNAMQIASHRTESPDLSALRFVLANGDLVDTAWTQEQGLPMLRA
jgi:hypothetical protein